MLTAVNTTIRTYYDVLGVSADTHPVVIKAAYRALAKEYHPDAAGRATADIDKFIEIQKAYAVLSDPEQRQSYDADLREALPPDVAPAEAGQAVALWLEAGKAAEIQRIGARLALYSETLAASFQNAVHAGLAGENVTAYAEQLERDFFHEYFGDDADVQALARLLLLKSRTAAALKLNELVAGAAAQGGGDSRQIVAFIAEHYCADEALFAEWLKVKFGLMPVQPAPPPAAAAVPPPRQAAPATARAARRSESANTLRSFATLAFWACALYFALFAAFPLIQ